MTSVTFIRNQNRNARNILDNFTITYARQAYDAIKQGSNSSPTWNSYNQLREDFVRFCGLTYHNGKFYNYTVDGSVKYYLSDLRITQAYHPDTESPLLTFCLEYTIVVPLYFMGAEVSVASIPVKLISDYTPKF